MNTVHEIKSAVSKLSREELAAFRVWFQEFDAEAWDRQFEADIKAGRLVHLPKRRYAIFTRVGARTCEAPGQPRVLAVLCCTS
jgi:hypothetical protein